MKYFLVASLAILAIASKGEPWIVASLLLSAVIFFVVEPLVEGTACEEVLTTSDENLVAGNGGSSEFLLLMLTRARAAVLKRCRALVARVWRPVEAAFGRAHFETLLARVPWVENGSPANRRVDGDQLRSASDVASEAAPKVRANLEKGDRPQRSGEQSAAIKRSLKAVFKLEADLRNAEALGLKYKISIERYGEVLSAINMVPVGWLISGEPWDPTIHLRFLSNVEIKLDLGVAEEDARADTFSNSGRENVELLDAESDPFWPELRALGIAERPADLDALKLSYRKRMLKAHPDHGGSTREAQEVNQAYRRLLEEYGVRTREEG